MYTLADHCWVPLLGAIAGDKGGYFVQVGGLDVVTLLGAIAGLPLLATGGGCTRWRIGRGAVAAWHCWAAIAGDRGGGGCIRWRTIAGRRCWAPLLGIGGVVTLLGAIAGLPLLGAIAGDRGGCTRWRIGHGAVAGCQKGGGGCTSWRIGCGDVFSPKMPLLCATPDLFHPCT